MTVVEPTARSGLVARVKGILLQPKAEWERINAEPATVQSLYTGYILLLAAIPPLARLIGGQLFGYGVGFLGWGVHWKPAITGAIAEAVISYLLGLVSVFVLALVIEFLAPTFGGEKNRIQALKVAAYSLTAYWVASILNIVPALGAIAVLLGLYSFYLLYLGLPRLMRTTADKAIPYTAVALIAAFVLMIIIGAVTYPLRMMGSTGPWGAASAPEAAAVTIPGMGTVNVNELEAAAERMERAAENPPPATPIATLQAMLPATVAGLPREAVSSGSGGVGGLQASEAEATYVLGESRLTLKVSDIGAMGGLAALGSAFNVQSNQDDGTTYEKVGQVDGRMTTERYDRAGKSGTYSIVVGQRFVVEAEGQNVSMDQLKQATRTVNVGRLEQMAKAS